jgi:acyl-CoA thioester hydrolase
LRLPVRAAHGYQSFMEKALFCRHRSVVCPEWIDFNGHMNVAYYMLAFDDATTTFFDHLGIGEGYMARTNCSTFTLEGHITYDREVKEADELLFSTRLLDYDSKRLHYFHEMYHAEDGFLASTNEMITAHIDMSVRRMTPFPPEMLERFATMLAAHKDLPRAPQIGRSIGIRRKS